MPKMTPDQSNTANDWARASWILGTLTASEMAAKASTPYMAATICDSRPYWLLNPPAKYVMAPFWPPATYGVFLM